MGPDRRRTARRGQALVTAALLAWAALAPGTALAAGSAPSPAPAPPAASARPAPQPAPRTASAAPAPSAEPPAGAHAPPGRPALAPAFGAFLHYGPTGVRRMRELGRWLGGQEPRVGHTYLPGDVWSNIEGANGFLDSWAAWRRARADRMLVVNVPMMERNEADVPDREVRALLRRAASGAFDAHFRTLARRLVALGVPDTVIVLGWEMNGITYTHRCAPDPQSWKRYWRRIVTTMRAVEGARFRFDFAPSRGTDAVPWPRCYPGDDVVDIVGMDSYDQPRGLSFDEQVTEPYGLQYQVDFARRHGKPISYPEWGLFRNGDNITYMLRMLAWMDQYKPLYQTITDYCPHGVWLCSDNPRASALYRVLLSGALAPRPDPGPLTPAPTPVPAATPDPTPTPTPTPTPDPPATTPVPAPAALASLPPGCTPAELQKWLGQEAGGASSACLARAKRYR